MGSSSITGDETIGFFDNMSFDGTPRAGKITTNGQLWIGSTAAPHVRVGTITSPDASVTIGYSTPNITLSTTSGVFTWVDVSGAFSPVKNTGYFITGTATGTLPAGPAQGDTIKFFVDHATQDLTIQASPGQTIRMGALITSVAGTALSTAQGDSATFVFRASNNSWQAVCGMIGTWVIA